jgi:hypothetical protein
VTALPDPRSREGMFVRLDSLQHRGDVFVRIEDVSAVYDLPPDGEDAQSAIILRDHRQVLVAALCAADVMDTFVTAVAERVL